MLVFFAQLAILLATARILGGVARRFGHPAVVGELTAGLVLGPSVLGKLSPSVSGWLFPFESVQWVMLLAVANLGVVLLLVITGFETDLELIRRLGRPAAVVAAGSILVPYGLGLAPGFLMPSSFHGPSSENLVFALFVAAALTTSSLAVVAKVLGEMQLLRRNFGQITLAVGMANEIVGYVVLGVIAGLALSGTVSLGAVGATLAAVGLFGLVAMTVGQRLVDFIFRRMRGTSTGVGSWLSVALVLAFTGGAITQAIGVEAVFGAFVVGILIRRSRYGDLASREHLEVFTLSFLAPLFFATAGLRVDLGVLDDPVVAAWAAVVVLVAWGAKFGGVFLAARVVGLEPREGAALGVGLNARGVLEVLIGTVGLAVGVFNSTSYTIVVLAALLSSIVAPPVLRAVVRDWAGTTSEQERLQREEALGGNVLVRAERVLVPSRGGPDSRLAAWIVDQAWPEEAHLTVVSVSPNGDRADLAAMRATIANRELEVLNVAGPDPAASVAKQAALGYGAIALGAVEAKTDGRLVSPIVDELLASSPVPLLVVRRGDAPPRLPTGHFRRIIVPVSGTMPSRAAAEVGFAIAARQGCPVVLVHVISSPEEQQEAPHHLAGRIRSAVSGRGAVDRTLVARDVLDEAVTAAQRQGVDAIAMVREANFPAEEIVLIANELGADLVVIGATMRQLAGRPFVGHNAEHILEHSDATVVVVTAPSGWPSTAV